MQVENHPQILRLRLADSPVEHLEPGLAQGVVVRRIHPPERLQVDAHRVEPGLFQQAEVLGLEPALGARAPDRIVAEDVHAAPQFSVLLEGVRGCRLGVTDWNREHEDCGQQQRWPA